MLRNIRAPKKRGSARLQTLGMSEDDSVVQMARIGQVGRAAGGERPIRARHDTVTEWRHAGTCPVEAAREMDSEGWRESAAFSRRSGFEEPQ